MRVGCPMVSWMKQVVHAKDLVIFSLSEISACLANRIIGKEGVVVGEGL